MRTTITADRLWDGARSISDPVVVIEDGCIAQISSRKNSEVPANAQHFTGTLAPAFFDVHIHGSAGHDVMEASEQALETVGSFLATRGVANYLATTVTAPIDDTLRALNGLAQLIRNRPAGALAWPIGIHLEGPFLSHEKRGVHPPHLLLAPDIALFDRMLEAAEGLVPLMTLAPELPGAVEFAAHAVSRGVRVSVGHSNATSAQTRAVIAAGATSATHTFNAMRALDHREPGILGTILSTDSLYADLICDGIHTAPEMVRLWWKAKGSQRAILITDAMSAAGMPDGTYQLGGFPVQVAEGRAMAGGVLAGSVLTLDKALSNFLAFTGAPLHQALRLLSTNPAAMLGESSGIGLLQPGAPANLVALDDSGRLLASVVSGIPAQLS